MWGPVYFILLHCLKEKIKIISISTEIEKLSLKSRKEMTRRHLGWAVLAVESGGEGPLLGAISNLLVAEPSAELMTALTLSQEVRGPRAERSG